MTIFEWWNKALDEYLEEEKPVRCQYCGELYFPKEGCHCAAFALHQA